MARAKGGIYSDVWERLKKEQRVELQLTQRSQVQTIIRGVRDTKYRDRAFHLVNGDIPWVLNNSFNPLTNKLLITLSSAYDIKGVQTDE